MFFLYLYCFYAYLPINQAMMKPFRQSLPVGNARFHDPLYLTNIGCEDIGVAE